RRKIHLPGSAAAGEISILGADHNLLLRRTDAGPRVYAGAATWLDDVGADIAQHVDVTELFAVLANLNRAELYKALNVRVNSLASSERFAKHSNIHVEIFFLSGCARASVCDIDLHRLR